MVGGVSGFLIVRSSLATLDETLEGADLWLLRGAQIGGALEDVLGGACSWHRVLTRRGK